MTTLSSGKTEFPEWQNHVEDLAFEYDREKLSQKIEHLEGLIFERLQQLSNGERNTEVKVIHEVAEMLRTIKRDRLGFPDWESGGVQRSPD